MKPKKLMITGIILAAVVVIALVGYNIYRYPAALKNPRTHQTVPGLVQTFHSNLISPPFKSYRQHVNVKDQPNICRRLFFTPATLLISLMHSSL